ncbi:hypothetical protein BZM27_42850 [Paraburkholderia steynii]|uniref:Uncharacterized protein n=1 Tax=Paraburkholderia steynii TaxID=1245441 RepID=A0A4R0X259_9BURK|nr:hypothetical protein BZM27_42850 [Paraburkholderia steynii]
MRDLGGFVAYPAGLRKFADRTARFAINQTPATPETHITTPVDIVENCHSSGKAGAKVTIALAPNIAICFPETDTTTSSLFRVKMRCFQAIPIFRRQYLS